MTAKKTDYYIEVTDTFGGEANYSWVRRYKVRSVSMLGAVNKLSRHYNLSFRKTFDGELVRYDARHAAVCAWITEGVDDTAAQYFDIQPL